MKYIYKTIVFISVLLFFTNTSFARTINVPSEFATIGKAVSDAVDGDVILVAPGIYLETPSIRKNIELKSTGDAFNTIIDGGGDGTVVLFVDAEFDGISTPKISGFTIQNGGSSVGRGGGITLYNSDVIIEDNRIVNNSAGVDGGGILLNSASTGTIRNNYINSNTATRFGGGINVVGGSNPLIYNNDIGSNSVSGPTYGSGIGKWGASGGGIYVDGNSSPQIISNTISGNSADFSGAGISLRTGSSSIVEDNIIHDNTTTTGAGIHIETAGGSPTIKGNTIYNNTALMNGVFPYSGFGGGISIYNNSIPQITDNIIYDNFATQGGGGIVSSENGNSTIINNKIYSNETKSDSGEYAGGAIYVADSTVTMKNNVIYENKARLGGGIALLDSATASINGNTIIGNFAPFDAGRKSGGGIFVKSSVTSAIIYNNIITQNEDYQIVEWVKKAAIYNNLINNDDLGIYFNDSIEINDITTLNSDGNVDADANISGNEEFTNQAGDNYNILQTSSAVDQGTSNGNSLYDIEYHLRPDGSGVDIGAYEYTTNNNITSPMYRFWSDAYQKHFYTIEKSERNSIFDLYPVNIWKYERIAYRSYKNSSCVGNNVYRFWSDSLSGHFYTITDAEKDYIIANYPTNIWSYEGPKFCARTSATTGTLPLYRFWSDVFRGHFYTASEVEKDYVIANYADNIWKYERIGFYVYPTQ